MLNVTNHSILFQCKFQHPLYTPPYRRLLHVPLRPILAKKPYFIPDIPGALPALSFEHTVCPYPRAISPQYHVGVLYTYMPGDVPIA